MSICLVVTGRDRATGEARVCAEPVRDWTICAVHANQLRQDLAETPALAGDIERTMARLRSAGPGGTKGAETPMPYDVCASEALGYLRAVLVGWIRDLDENPEHHPADDIVSMAHWLYARHHRLASHPAAEEVVREFAEAYTAGRRALDTGGPERMFLGLCQWCTAELFAPTDATVVRCRGCEAEHDPADLRDALTIRIAGHLVTAQEFSGYAVRYLGLNPRAQGRLEDSVRAWASRKVVTAQGHAPRPDGPAQPTYRFGDLRGQLDKRNERSA